MADRLQMGERDAVREGFANPRLQFVGQRVQVRLEEEKYVKDGEQKTVLRVKRYSPAEADEAF